MVREFVIRARIQRRIHLRPYPIHCTLCGLLNLRTIAERHSYRPDRRREVRDGYRGGPDFAYSAFIIVRRHLHSAVSAVGEQEADGLAGGRTEQLVILAEEFPIVRQRLVARIRRPCREGQFLALAASRHIPGDRRSRRIDVRDGYVKAFSRRAALIIEDRKLDAMNAGIREYVPDGLAGQRVAAVTEVPDVDQRLSGIPRIGRRCLKLDRGAFDGGVRNADNAWRYILSHDSGRIHQNAHVPELDHVYARIRRSELAGSIENLSNTTGNLPLPFDRQCRVQRDETYGGPLVHRRKPGNRFVDGRTDRHDLLVEEVGGRVIPRAANVHRANCQTGGLGPVVRLFLLQVILSRNSDREKEFTIGIGVGLVNHGTTLFEVYSPTVERLIYLIYQVDQFPAINWAGAEVSVEEPCDRTAIRVLNCDCDPCDPGVVVAIHVDGATSGEVIVRPKADVRNVACKLRNTAIIIIVQRKHNRVVTAIELMIDLLDVDIIVGLFPYNLPDHCFVQFRSILIPRQVVQWIVRQVDVHQIGHDRLDGGDADGVGGGTPFGRPVKFDVKLAGAGEDPQADPSRIEWGKVLRGGILDHVYFDFAHFVRRFGANLKIGPGDLNVVLAGHEIIERPLGIRGRIAPGHKPIRTAEGGRHLADIPVPLTASLAIAVLTVIYDPLADQRVDIDDIIAVEVQILKPVQHSQRCRIHYVVIETRGLTEIKLAKIRKEFPASEAAQGRFQTGICRCGAGEVVNSIT